MQSFGVGRGSGQQHSSNPPPPAVENLSQEKETREENQPGTRAALEGHEALKFLDSHSCLTWLSKRCSDPPGNSLVMAGVCESLRAVSTL